MLGQGAGSPESVLSPETPAQVVDNGVPSCADVKLGFLSQQCSVSARCDGGCNLERLLLRRTFSV